MAELSWVGICTCCPSVLSFAGKGYCKQAGKKESVKEDHFPSVCESKKKCITHTTESDRVRMRPILWAPSTL